MLIVITGLDGSGTSTIAKKLKELDKTAHILKTPSTEYKCRDLVDEKVKDVSPVGHMLYYLSSNVYMSDYIRKNFNIENENVYVIRYLIDTVVSNRVAGVPIELDYNIYENNILKPDLTLFVSVDEDKRQKRITERGKSILDKVLDDDITREKFIKEFEKNLDHETTIYVDNNSSDIEQTAKTAYKKIKKFEKNLNEVIKFIGTCNDYYESSISGFFTPVPAFMINDIDKNKTKLTVYLRLLTKTVNITEGDFVVFNFETLDLSVYPEKNILHTFHTL